MPIAQSKLTSQGQLSLPADVRRKLGVGPGSVVEWEEEEGKIVVRRSGRFSFEDVHKAVFPRGVPKRRSLRELKAGVGRYLKRKHASR